MVQNAIQEFLNFSDLGIVGVSKDTSKYGNIVYRNLKSKGYNIYPVNPKLEDIDGQNVYKTVGDLPDSIKAIVTVVPPTVTEDIVQQASEHGITHVWMQPGSESDKAVQYCHDHDIAVIHNDCVMVESRKRS